MANYDRIKLAMGELDEDEVLNLLKEVIADGGNADEALSACQEGMNIVGSRFEENEYFVSDLIFAGDLMTQAVEVLRPALVKDDGSGKAGKMILCTVAGDLHDIGKNIVKSMLEAASLEVVDLGIDVPPAKILEAAKEQGIHIIGLSGVLTLAIGSMSETVKAFIDAGMRNDVKIIIGGAPVNEEVWKVTGADAWAVNPQDTVRTCAEWSKQFA